MRKVGYLFASALLLLAVFMSDHATAQSSAQKLLPLEELTVKTGAGNFTFSIEVADTPAERSIGLMNRKSMPLTHGMLFDFKRVKRVDMWMENTFISLDMIFAKSDGRIVKIARDTTPHSRAIITSGQPVSHVLELNAGVSRQIGLKVGDKLEHRLFSE